MANHRKCECGTCSRCRHREYMRDWYWRNRERACEIARTTRERHADKIRAADRERGYRPPEDQRKTLARQAVNIAVRRGELIRRPCEICGASKTDAHHDDYDRPLEVRWLCRTHHGAVHRRPVPY